MNKWILSYFVIAAGLIGACLMYDTFIFRPRLLHMQAEIQVIEKHKGEMTYLIFTSRYGGVHEVNYTLDSAELEMRRKFDK